MKPFHIAASNLAEMFGKAAQIYGDLPAFATRRGAKDWIPVSFKELYERGCALATGLMELGVGARDRVGLLGDNRFEWILADYAVQLCGAADVPRGRDVTDDEIRFIFRHAGVEVAFVETDKLRDRLLRLRSELPDLREIVVLDSRAGNTAGVHALDDLLALGQSLRSRGDRRVEERVAGIQGDDLFTLIYTSGTTGEPKGVMLTHANMLSQIEAIPLDMNCTDRALSILPVWHIFERVFEMISISRGACTYYSSIRTLAEDMESVQPTFMGSAPRMWERIHQRLLDRVRTSHPIRRALFHTAYFLSHHYQNSMFFLRGRSLDLQGRGPVENAALSVFHAVRAAVTLPFYAFFNVAVLERLRMVAGGELRGSISGGGALPKKVDEFFNYVGIPVLEGYGMTETSPVISVRTPSRLVIGTVGPVIPQTEVRIVCLETGKTLYPDPSRRDLGRGLKGEIAVRGPQVMKGYYRNPTATDNALRDGWMHTGDIGIMTFNDCLKIVGRSKETIVLSNGENLEPAPIEVRLIQSALVEHVVVVGQDRKQIAALIVPSVEGYAARGIKAESIEALAVMEEARALMAREVRDVISEKNGFKAHERIRDFCLLSRSFEIGEEMTNLFKIRRHVVTQKYHREIESLYAAGERSAVNSKQ